MFFDNAGPISSVFWGSEWRVYRVPCCYFLRASAVFLVKEDSKRNRERVLFVTMKY